MSTRNFSNWIDGYMEYVDNTESATQFHRWVAFSCLAAALQRKCWFRFGIFKTYPNLYVVLVSEPGIGRKTKAISIGRKFIEEIPNIRLGPSVVASPQALYIELENAGQDDVIRERTIRHSSLTLFSDEFEVYLGQKGENAKLITQLTDFYDCANTFEYKAKQSASSTIPNIFLNLLAATTPSSLAQSFPISAVGGGLSRRITFIWAASKAKSVPIPETGSADMFAKLVADLHRIAMIAGEVTFTPEAREWWINWYNNYKHDDPNRKCLDTNFTGWYSVKPTLIQKLAMLSGAAERNITDITAKDFEKATAEIESIEEGMALAFSGVGRSDTSADVKQVEDIIKNHNSIKEDVLFQLIWRDIDQQKFDNVIFPTLRKKGTVDRKYEKDESGRMHIVYYWTPSVVCQ